MECPVEQSAEVPMLSIPQPTSGDDRLEEQIISNDPAATVDRAVTQPDVSQTNSAKGSVFDDAVCKRLQQDLALKNQLAFDL